MDLATISIKTESKTLAKTQEIAEEIGVSLNSLMSALLKYAIKTKGAVLKLGRMTDEQRVEIIKMARKEEKSQ